MTNMNCRRTCRSMPVMVETDIQSSLTSYCPCEALRNGTLFTTLNKPMRHRCCHHRNDEDAQTQNSGCACDEGWRTANIIDEETEQNNTCRQRNRCCDWIDDDDDDDNRCRQRNRCCDWSDDDDDDDNRCCQRNRCCDDDDNDDNRCRQRNRCCDDDDDDDGDDNECCRSRNRCSDDDNDDDNDDDDDCCRRNRCRSDEGTTLTQQQNCCNRQQANNFALWELRLYLDTHPWDTQARAMLRQLNERCDQPGYATAFLPRRQRNGCCENNLDTDGCWRWLDEPWPWEHRCCRED